jgi:hypothetical protein
MTRDFNNIKFDLVIGYIKVVRFNDTSKATYDVSVSNKRSERTCASSEGGPGLNLG